MERGQVETIGRGFGFQLKLGAEFPSANATAELSWLCHDLGDGFCFVSLPSSVMQSG
jgi:hypothetical protein